MKRRLVPVAVLAVVLGAVWAFRSGPEGAVRPVVRGEPPVPAAPPPAGRAAYYFGRMVSGDQSKHPAAAQASWRLFGETPLRELGAPALDYLLAEERTPLYRARPNVLVNVLRLLPAIEGLRSHPRLQAFLRHWLDPANCPPRGPGADWAADLRRAVFAVLAQAPDPSLAPLCVEELTRADRTHDLRKEAIGVLMHAGCSERLVPLYASLPPVAAEPGPPYLRHFVLDQAYGLAAGGSGARAEAAKLEAVARAALGSDAPGERVKAAGLLLRLGDDSMEDLLLDEYERGRTSRAEQAGALSALLLALENRAGPRAKAICLELIEGDQASFVAPLLVRGWGEEEAVRERVWRHVEGVRPLPQNALLALGRYDRARVVALVRARIATTAGAEQADVIRFAGQQGLREVVPDLLDLAKRATDETERALHYATLARLGAREVVPLIRHELRRAADDPPWRQTLATILLPVGGDALDAVGEALEDRDEAVLLALVGAATTSGRAAVPDALVGPLLRAVREMPGEGGRWAAVVVLRCRGTIDGVREGLVDAYRREPSSRVAREIADALEDLAHR